MSNKDVPARELELKLAQIKALIVDGHIEKMRDLKSSSPTKIAKYAGIN